MESEYFHTNDLYRDISERCNGEIYIGIVGPVRTGKSTFIKRFMDLLVLPNMTDENEKNRTRDELPQSGDGKTITTMEPKFIPNKAVSIRLEDDVFFKVRLIDCVGYMVEGAGGYMENGKERLVKTPWFDEAIPFSKAAEIGTDKVILKHSAVGIVVVSDGSFTDLEKDAYLKSAQEAILRLKKLNKPFVVLINSTRPYGDTAKEMASEIEQNYHVKAIPVNCAQLKKEDIYEILKELLYAFPISKISFITPKWFQFIPQEHPLRDEMISCIKKYTMDLWQMKDFLNEDFLFACESVRKVKPEEVNLSNGIIQIRLEVDDAIYFELISSLLGEKIESEHDLIHILKEIGEHKKEYEKVEKALEDVRLNGYGVVTPEMNEISLMKPEVIKNGNKYGIKIVAHSPSIHMIKADVESEISPIVGTKTQAEDLISFIEGEEEKEQGIWDTNIFGKTVEQLVREGIEAKMANIGNESQLKLQETMQKIVNESTGGMVCIII